MIVMPFFLGDVKAQCSNFRAHFSGLVNNLRSFGARPIRFAVFTLYRQTRDEIVQVWSLLRITLILSFKCGSCKLS